ncbi:MAG: DUF1800 family protein [Pseudomonadota bacterium]
MTLDAAIACNRFGLGARRGEIARVAGDPAAWLDGQLNDKVHTAFPAQNLRSSEDLLVDLIKARQQRQKARQSNGIDAALAKSMSKLVRNTLRSETHARTSFGAMTDAPFHERLVRFWANHFTVAARNPQTTIIAGAYEREAIRPNILSSFTDLAERAILHQGMLIYLDNIQSVGPSSRVGKRRKRGLNENLAREVLELHTVTPEAGYSQDDVEELSKALTGWTVGHKRFGTDALGKTVFVEHIHEPGARRVLGKRYADSGSDQARRILADLSKSPHTAHHIATKLARHFVSDRPPERLIKSLKTAFLDSDGDLKSLYRILIDAPELWATETVKVKSPDELLTSASRLLSVQSVFAGNPRDVFTSLAQQPFTAPSPAGWPDSSDHWIGPDALSKRIEWANRVSLRSSNVDARATLKDGLGEQVSPQTLQAVSRAESSSQALALALLSPDFQRR